MESHDRLRAPAASHEAITDPRAEYQRRLELRRAAVQRDERYEGWISTARGLVFLAGLALVVVAVRAGDFTAWHAIAPCAAFLTLVFAHGRVLDRLALARRSVTHYETALARVDGDWSGRGPAGERYLDPEHMYAADLDVFGTASLFQLLCRARTRPGEDMLAAWLSAPANLDVLQARQKAVAELRPRLDLRESLAVLGAEVHDDLDQNKLRRWSQETPQLLSLRTRVFATVLGAGAVLGLLAWLVFDTGPSPVVGVLIVEVLLTFAFRKRLKELSHSADEAGSGLAILAHVLDLIEREQFQSERLQAVRTRLNAEGQPPSKQIHRLNGLIQNLNNSLENQFFAPIAFALGLHVHLIHAIESWRARVGPHIPDWLDAVGEFEALGSIAGYAYENPDNVTPEFTAEGPLFEGEQLGHPLLPRGRCVANDAAIGGTVQLVLVSGSNMSGKSTYLRTIGTNAVLALAGAPVRARRLRLSRVQIATAMRINDSLQAGRSLFYAVVSRLKSVVDLAGHDPPLLFLLDEILQGTNSHDRRLGSEAVLKELIDRGAIGLVTTHDLALTRIADSLAPRAINVHFEDQLSDGRMSFDYRVRPGVVQKSNALELMRMMGLDV